MLDSLPTWLKTLLSAGIILMVAALFSQINAPIGGVVVAGVGAILFYIDFVPPELGAGVVLLSLVGAAAMFVAQQGDGL